MNPERPFGSDAFKDPETGDSVFGEINAEAVEEEGGLTAGDIILVNEELENLGVDKQYWDEIKDIVDEIMEGNFGKDMKDMSFGDQIHSAIDKFEERNDISLDIEETE